MSRPPLPPFTRETAIEKVRLAEDGWNSRDAGKVARAGGFASPGEAVRRVRDAEGGVSEIWIGGSRLAREADFAREIVARYEGSIRKA